MPPRLESLQRYPLSVILSFLTEVEGTSTLLTIKRFSRVILPLFCFPSNGLTVAEPRKRHRFIVYPAQDPMTLLDRLNTRRLKLRLRSRGHDNECYALNQTIPSLALLESRTCRFHFPADQELLRFLDTKELLCGTTILASYPRSGNTFLRNLLERTMGVVTGSDNRPDRTLSKALAVEHNLIGEGVTRHVHVVKTHFPERVGMGFEGQRAIVLIRNPYDAIDSYWNLNLTNTHTKTVTDEIYNKYNDTFQALAKNEMKIWIEFHHYWLHVDIPVLLVKFEDLIVNVQSEMKRVIKFVMNQDELSDSWKARIKHASGEGRDSSTLGSYKPRSATSGKASIGKSLRKKRYTDDQLREFHVIAQQSKRMEKGETMLEYFGYDMERQGFPTNIVHEIPEVATLGSTKCMVINQGQVIRPFTDPYGRAMKQWRQARTNMDKNPFPTVA